LFAPVILKRNLFFEAKKTKTLIVGKGKEPSAILNDGSIIDSNPESQSEGSLGGAGKQRFFLFYENETIIYYFFSKRRVFCF
jgi:hypothetical protein